MRIAGYTYRADVYCPACIVEAVTSRLLINPSPTEHRLNDLAEQRGIDRMDEYSFDSDEFPKVIFSVQVDDDEFCCVCGEEVE